MACLAGWCGRCAGTVPGAACRDGAGPDLAPAPRASAWAGAWLIAARLLAPPTGAAASAEMRADTPADTPATAATVAAATPSVSREGRRGKRYRSRNEDADERWRGDKINLRVGAGEHSAVTQGAA